jgi:hypothetical protein
VWAGPFVDVAIFGAAWETYRFKTCTTTSWQTLFNAIKAAPFMSVDEVTHIGKATKASDLMFTPHKTFECLVKRLRTADADKKDEKRDLKAKIFTELSVELRPLQLRACW